MSEDGYAVRFAFPDGETWEFETDAADLAIEESILMSDTRGNRRADQVVIYGRVQQNPTVAWRLHRTAIGARRGRATPAADETAVEG